MHHKQGHLFDASASGGALFGCRMVQERVLPKSEDDLSGIEIVDNTPPAVDAQIAKEEVAAGVTPPEAVEPAPPSEQVEPPKAELPVTPVTPKVRQYTEDEWNKRQSALDRQLAEERRQRAEDKRKREEVEAQLAEIRLNSDVESYRQNEERRLSATLDPEHARIQASANAEVRRAQLNSQREAEKAKAGQAEAFSMVKLAAADRIRGDFGLEDRHIDHLMSARSLDHMIQMARDFQSGMKVKEEVRARVPNGQRAESPVSMGRGALTHDELVDIYNTGDDSNPRYQEASKHVEGLMRRRR